MYFFSHQTKVFFLDQPIALSGTFDYIVNVSDVLIAGNGFSRLNLMAVAKYTRTAASTGVVLTETFGFEMGTTIGQLFDSSTAATSIGTISVAANSSSPVQGQLQWNEDMIIRPGLRKIHFVNSDATNPVSISLYGDYS